jgi:hypothetical protein
VCTPIYVQIQAGLPQLLLVKELMTALVNDEDSYGECGKSTGSFLSLRDLEKCLSPLSSPFSTDPQFSYALFSPSGYYLATLEAATQHIFDLAEQYEQSAAAEAQQLDANGEDVLDSFDEKVLH